ncbi:MAG: hypothetical protein ACPGUV_02725 [Polyangiales bacterium]
MLQSTESLNGKALYHPYGVSQITSTWQLFPEKDAIHSPDSKQLIVGNRVGNLFVLDAVSLAVVHASERQARAAWVESLVFAPDGALWAGCSDGKVGVWTLDPFECVVFMTLE